jgi:hypothetical protein
MGKPGLWHRIVASRELSPAVEATGEAMDGQSQERCKRQGPFQLGQGHLGQLPPVPQPQEKLQELNLGGVSLPSVP